MIKIMCRFPKVEDFVTVLNGRKESRNCIGDEEHIERYIQWKVIGRRWGAAKVASVSSIDKERNPGYDTVSWTAVPALLELRKPQLFSWQMPFC